MSQITKVAGGGIVLAGAQTGHTVIPAPTPLTRLNYFDGKFLRADDLRVEQQYFRTLVAFANQAGGAGVVHGFDVALQTGDRLGLGPGLAISGAGRVLFLPDPVSVPISTLLAASEQRFGSLLANRVHGAEFGDCVEVSETPPSDSPRGSDLYLITIGHAEALCGEEDVYGKLCEDACVTSTDRPYRVEGIVVRAIPLVLQTPLATSRVITLDRRHLRSLVASAYFADEANRIGHLISRDGLSRETWCHGAEAVGNGDVPVGVLARAGNTTVFLDAWTARRERIETPPRRYWAWRMMMRPWDVFLAQVLQFQCHLRDVLERAPEPGGGDDPCSSQTETLTKASEYLAEIERNLKAGSVEINGNVSKILPGGIQKIQALSKEVLAALQSAGGVVGERILINRGIVELPSAGYLPVVPGSAVTVNTQVRRLLGDGVDLRFCVVRPDYVAHALEEAQHMERISLLRGLDDPAAKEAVDILVPDGQILPGRSPTGLMFDTRLSVLLPEIRFAAPTPSDAIGPAPGFEPPGARVAALRTGDGMARAEFRGAGRAEALASGGGAFHFAGTATVERQTEQPKPQLSHATLHATEATTEFTTAQPAGSVVFALGGAPGAAGATTAPVSETAANVRLAVNREIDTTLAGWLSLRCERNPFTMARGETTRLTGEAALGSTPRADRAMGIDVAVDGTLYVTEAARAGAATQRVVGRVTRALASITSILNGQAVDTQADRISFDVELALVSAPEGESTLEVVLRHADGFEVSARTTWSGDPILASLELMAGRETENRPEEGDETIQIATAAAREDPEIFHADHKLHILALSALTRLERALAQPGFRATAESALFPPVPADDTLTVRATRDWVLFHRRREKRCAPVARPAVPPRQYQVYHARVAGPDELAMLREALRSGKGLDDFEFSPVAVADFAPGAATLLTDSGELRDAWRQVNPGDRLPLAAVATVTASALAEGAEVARARLHELALALAPVTTIDANATFDVLSAAPPQLSPAGSDGTMLLVTRPTPQVNHVCHDVLRAPHNEWEAFNRFLDSGNLPAAVQILSNWVKEFRLGDVHFEAGTANVVSETAEPVKKAWDEQVGAPPVVVAAVRIPLQTPDSAHLEQSRVIGTLVGYTATPLVRDVSSFGQSIPGLECPMVTVLVFGQQ